MHLLILDWQQTPNLKIMRFWNDLFATQRVFEPVEGVQPRSRWELPVLPPLWPVRPTGVARRRLIGPGKLDHFVAMKKTFYADYRPVLKLISLSEIRWLSAFLQKLFLFCFKIFFVLRRHCGFFKQLLRKTFLSPFCWSTYFTSLKMTSIRSHYPLSWPKIDEKCHSLPVHHGLGKAMKITRFGSDSLLLLIGN